MNIEKFTQAIRRMNINQKYNKADFKEYCSNEEVRRQQPQVITDTLGVARCITKEGYGGGQTYRRNERPWPCEECPLSENCKAK